VIKQVDAVVDEPTTMTAAMLSEPMLPWYLQYYDAISRECVLKLVDGAVVEDIQAENLNDRVAKVLCVPDCAGDVFSP
jgi:hypothetical protein